MATGTIPKYADGIDSGWIAFDKGSNTYSGTVYYRKAGNIVYLRSDNLKNITGDVAFGYLPNAYKPVSDLYFSVFSGYPAYKEQMYLRIYSGGAVQLNLMSGETVTSNTTIGIMVSYIV